LLRLGDHHLVYLRPVERQVRARAAADLEHSAGGARQKRSAALGEPSLLGPGHDRVVSRGKDPAVQTAHPCNLRTARVTRQGRQFVSCPATMCGIAGMVGFEGTMQRRLVERMCRTMVHRGPDSYGLFADETAALGVQRL